jgi:opacity protein-like surface antigen
MAQNRREEAVDRRRLIVAMVCLLVPAAVSAQTARSVFTAHLTGSIGAAHGGDMHQIDWAPSVSMAIVDLNGFGAEVDLSHVREFDSDRFVESGITTLMANFTWIWPDVDSRYRPYVVAGAGVMRVRACDADCQLRIRRTDWAVDAGGGVFLMFNEAWAARGDLRYVRFLESHGDLPLTNSGAFDFWRTSVGIVYSWPMR